MRILVYLVVMFISQLMCGQLDSSVKLFEELSGVSIDSIDVVDDWEVKTTFFPSGRKQDEVRIYISHHCLEHNGKCIIRYQHQVYYDDENSTLALKEGKYLIVKKDNASYRHYGWWYSNKGKVYRKVSEKTTRHL